MGPPKSKSELENLLGMVNFLAKFTANLGESHHTYERSSKKDSKLAWDCAKDSAFKDMKMLIASAGTLDYFHTNISVTLEVDSSKHDQGAVEEYAQIEKEMYAIVFGA